MNLERRVAYWSDFGFTHYNDLFNLQERLASLRLQNKIPDIILFSEHYPIIRFGASERYNKFSNKFLSEVKKIYGDDGEENILKYLNNLGISFIRGLVGGQAAYIGPGQLVTYPIVDYKKIVGSEIELGKYKFLIDEIMYEVLKNDFGLKVEIVKVAEEFKEDEEGLRKDRKDIWLKYNGKNYKIGGKGIIKNRNVVYNGFTVYVKPQSLYGFDFILACGYNKNQLDVTCIENELGREISMANVRDKLLDKIKEKFNYNKLIYITPEDLERIEMNKDLVIPHN